MIKKIYTKLLYKILCRKKYIDIWEIPVFLRLSILFSPCIYIECMGKEIVDGFIDGFMNGTNKQMEE